jgi:hypothetical protein
MKRIQSHRLDAKPRGSSMAMAVAADSAPIFSSQA